MKHWHEKRQRVKKASGWAEEVEREERMRAMAETLALGGVTVPDVPDLAPERHFDGVFGTYAGTGAPGGGVSHVGAARLEKLKSSMLRGMLGDVRTVVSDRKAIVRILEQRARNLGIDPVNYRLGDF